MGWRADVGERGIWPVELELHRIQGPRRYRFVEHPWMAPDFGLFVLATVRNTDWPIRPPTLRPDDDLLVLFHPDTPDEVVGRVVNGLRDQGHEVIVERTVRLREASGG